ncbi:MAG: class I SAM-dependent methyltransferase [Chloroflexota bacterium]
MRYRVNNIEIRTESAAKPIVQKSKYLTDWILSREVVEEGLDYGCGKLRYSAAVERVCRNLTLVDSDVQLSRCQIIDNQKTTVIQYATATWPNVRLLTVDDFFEDTRQYEFILCANVLPIIPDYDIRNLVLKSLYMSLKPDGDCLFVAQYTNSFFTKLKNSPYAIPHLDGYLINGPKRKSYFGILPKRKIESLSQEHGFLIRDSWTEGQSAYVLVTK